jgi:V-type H+-transporting ATPase subunit E
MADAKAQQVNAMVKQIRDDAKKKCDEITAQAQQTYEVEKSKLMNELGDKARKDHAGNMKKIETQRAISRSTQINKARLKKVAERAAHLDKAVDSVKVQMVALSKDKNKYKDLLAKLVVQGCLKLLEPAVQVRCRDCDRQLVESCLAQAATLYATVVAKEAGKQLQVKLTMDSKSLPPPPSDKVTNSCLGGVTLVCHGGLITVDNTLDARLRLVVDQDKPTLRATLFPN